MQKDRNLTARMESLRFLLRGRDGKYGQTFDTVFQSDDLRVIKSAPQAPRMNTHCERVTGTIRRELLDHILMLSETHARQVLTTYENHYNRYHPTRPETSYRPRLNGILPRYTTWTPTDCSTPASSTGSSTSTDAPLDQQR
ncbi:integrase core domain-containing protein [Actinosynnema sp. NPDC023658]|uniref:integrase core domain-containing protein n=1 Tax=Actinosynnema sp. NPDC023658 TaxID=3155465 RepID=UPI0033EB1538